ncbi:hypothetical protein [Microbacterium sp.]|uniref:hypothetical protein n=1 Tax=Microbacterium sp. TaxID=51671 RepID=UPI0039E643FE
MSADRLRARDLNAPFWGVRSWPFQAPEHDGILDVAALEHRHRIDAYAKRMAPERFFAGLSALVIWCGMLPVAAPVLEVGVFAPHRAPRAAGVRGRQFAEHLASVRETSGLRVISPASTWVTLAPTLAPRDLIAVGSMMITQPRGPGGRDIGAPLTTLESLQAAVAAGPRPGIATARQALTAIRPGARSRAEVHLWLALVAAGLPEPLFDVPIHDASGELIGIGDLVFPELKVVVEYHGDYHRLSPRAWSTDITRRERLREADWMPVEVTRSELYPDESAAVGRVARALTARGFRVR